MPPRPTRKPKPVSKRKSSSSSEPPLPKPAKGGRIRSSLSPSFFLGPFLSLLALLLLNSSWIDLPNILVSTPSYLISLVSPRTSSPPISAAVSPLWVVTNSSNKGGGLALFTSPNLTSPLPAGTLLLQDTPLIVLPTRWKGSTMEEINGEVKAMVDQLGREERAWFYELSEGEEKGGEEGLELGREMRIVQTNAVDVGGDKVAVFRWFSRINHSCQPNAHYSFRTSSNSILIHSLSSLPPNTELLLSYLDPFLPTHIRQKELSSRYSFICTCPRCTNSVVTDQRSQERWVLRGEVGQWAVSQGKGGGTGKEAVKKLERVLELMRLEGVRSGRGQVGEDLVRVGWGCGDNRFVRHWALQSQQWFSEELGGDSEEALRMERLSRDEEGDREGRRLGWERREEKELLWEGEELVERERS